MTQTVIDRNTQAPQVRTPRRTVRPVRTRRPARGSGRAAAPVLRPAEACPAPALDRRGVVRPHSCVMPDVAVPAAATARATTDAGWRLTDRGVAVVLVAGLMIMFAALTVVGLTAVRVTGDSYQPSVTASLPR